MEKGRESPEEVVGRAGGDDDDDFDDADVDDESRARGNAGGSSR